MIDQWNSCYDDSWSGLIVPEAFAHPAKFSLGLIHRIYKHAKEMGWVHPGDYVLDLFAGVGLGAMTALSMGLHWVGVELEAKFVDLGQQNIDLWNRQLRGWPNLGTARIIQGDSRNLREVIERIDLIVSSPPYSDVVKRDRDKEGYAQKDREYSRGFKTPGADSQSRAYGHTPGNLANMKEGSIDLVCSSPPYAGSMESDKGGIDWNKAGRLDRTKPSGNRYSVMSNNDPTSYGTSPGQLGSMKEGEFACVVSSPPYDEGLGHGMNKVREIDVKKGLVSLAQSNYGKTSGNLGNSPGDTFWSASKEIVQGCFDLLKHEGHAIWVTKRYVKAGKIVPFSDRWQALCESVGFSVVCRHLAMLIKSHGGQMNTRGETEELSTERKSFFRRLAEKKGSPRIDWEDVICMEKS